MVFDGAGGVLEVVGFEFEEHEGLGRGGVFGDDVVGGGGGEAEAGVVGRMAEDDYGADVEISAHFEAGSDELGADAAILVGGRYGHGGEAHDFEMGVVGEGNGGEGDVADDGVGGIGGGDFGDEGDEGVGVLAELVDEVGFGGSGEAGGVYIANGGCVFFFFGADEHGVAW